MKWREGDGEAWKRSGSLDDESDVHIRARAVGVRFNLSMKRLARAFKKASVALVKFCEAMEQKPRE